MANDGEIDYSAFSLAQAKDALLNIDGRHFPKNRASLLCRLEALKAAQVIAIGEKPLDFDIHDDAEIVRAALIANVWRTWTKVGQISRFVGLPFLVAALAVAFVYYKNNWLAVALGIYLMAIPVQIIGRRALAKKLVARDPTRHITLSGEGVRFASGDHNRFYRWEQFSNIVEYPTFFLFSRGPSCDWIPRDGMPDDAMIKIRNVLAAGVL